MRLIGGIRSIGWLRVTLEHRHNFLLYNTHNSYGLDAKMRTLDVCDVAQGSLQVRVLYDLIQLCELFLLSFSDYFLHDAFRTTAGFRRPSLRPKDEGFEDLWRSGIHVHFG